MILLKNIIGMPAEKARELLKGYNIKITDLSSPDKYHSEIVPSIRVVKAIQTDNDVELFVAGFQDGIA